MTTRPVKGVSITTDKSGKVRVKAKAGYASVSQKIAQTKSKKTKVVRRAP